VEIAKTLDTTDPNPSKNQGGIAIVQPLNTTDVEILETELRQGSYADYVDGEVIAIDQQGGKGGANYAVDVMPTLCSDSHGTPHAVCYDARGNGDGKTVSTITGDHENRITDYSTVICLQGNGIDRADTAGCNGKGWKEDTCYTLNTIDRPAVAYEENADEPITLHGNKYAGTLMARDYKGVGRHDTLGSVVAIPTETKRYIVRRLTPTECARLQGFPDWWGHIEQKETLTDEEYRFWLEVRNTHAAINGKAVKEYNVKQMLTWYNKLWTDSAEYKMWGNVIALPPALYCMQGIADALTLSETEIDTAMTMAYDTVADDGATDLSDAPDEIKTEIVALAEKLEDREKTEEKTMETMEQKITEKQEAENAPIDFVAAAQLRKLAEERKALANLRPNDPRFADDVRALEFAVSVLEAVGL